jgi:transposase
VSKIFEKDGQKGMYGSPEFRVKQNEAMDILTGNLPWTDETREECLKIARGEKTSTESINEYLKKIGIDYTVE